MQNFIFCEFCIFYNEVSATYFNDFLRGLSEKKLRKKILTNCFKIQIIFIQKYLYSIYFIYLFGFADQENFGSSFDPKENLWHALFTYSEKAQFKINLRILLCVTKSRNLSCDTNHKKYCIRCRLFGLCFQYALLRVLMSNSCLVLVSTTELFSTYRVQAYAGYVITTYGQLEVRGLYCTTSAVT